MVGIVVISGIIFNPVFAEPSGVNKHLQLQGSVSNLGFGGSLGYYVSPQWMLGGDFSGLAMSLENTTHYDKVNHSLMTVETYLRYCPHFQAGLPKWCEMMLDGLFCQAGVAGRNWKFETIENDPKSDGVKAVVTFSPAAAMAGLGFNWILTRGLSFGVGADFYFGTKPAIDITGGPTALTSDMTSTRSEVEKHHYMNATTLGVSAFAGYDF
jgi:hypothetical protein